MKKKADHLDKINADELWKVAWTYITTVVDTLREPFIILDEDLRVISANKTFYKYFDVKKSQTEGKLIYDLGNKQWNIPQLKELLEDILPKNTHFEDFKVEHNFPVIGERVILLNARRIFATGNTKPIMLLAMEDITKQKQLDDQLKAYAEKLTSEVAKRTADLESRVTELKRMNNVMVNREMKMIDLKKEIVELKKLNK
jgi:chemotaxis protein methyltransferase CheR